MQERQLASETPHRQRRRRHLVLTRPAQSLRAVVVLILGAVVLVAGYWATDLLLRRGPPPRIDAFVLDWIAGRRTTATLAASEVLSILGDLVVVLPVAAGLLVLVVRRAQRWDAVALVVTVVGGVLLITSVVKELTDRARPTGGLIDVISHAFPSGHASRAAAVYGLLWWVALRWGRSAPFRLLGGALALGMIVATGMSRLLLGVHWPSDVLFGWLLGAGWLVICLLLLQPRHALHPTLDDQRNGDA